MKERIEAANRPQEDNNKELSTANTKLETSKQGALAMKVIKLSMFKLNFFLKKDSP